MNHVVELKLPDIGGHTDVEVIEVFVKVGDTIQENDALITIETDKASMEVPSTATGKIKAVHVQVGSKVSEGDLILVLEPEQGASTTEGPAVLASISDTSSSEVLECDVVVLGGGPGGYTAAFRSADLGLSTILIERYPNLGGVCLNVGCIPSKALLHVAKVITEAEEMKMHGLEFGAMGIDLDKLRGFKDRIIHRLSTGLSGLAKQRKVQVIQGHGQFTSPHTIEVRDELKRPQTIRFRHAIIAAGSTALKIPGYPYEDPRIITSTGALQITDIPQRMLIVGGGIIGLEMACVYAALGTQISIVDLADGLVPGADRDIVKVLAHRITPRYEAIMTKTKVSQIKPSKTGLTCWFEGEMAPSKPQTYDKILVAVGRQPNGKEIGAEHAGIPVDDRGFIHIDNQCRTAVPHIFAIGDIAGNPMLAHKATHQGKCAAEVIAGQSSYLDFKAIPFIAYTDPEVAWFGLTETEAKAKGTVYEKAVFPWAASGRALGSGREDGLTKILFEPQTNRILGAAIVGIHAGELLGEVVLAYEMGANIEDIAMTIHAHPTLSETVGLAAEIAQGSITDLFIPKRR